MPKGQDPSNLGRLGRKADPADISEPFAPVHNPAAGTERPNRPKSYVPARSKRTRGNKPVLLFPKRPNS